MLMKTGTGSDSIDRRAWILWGVTFIVVIALTIAVPLLYIPLLRLLGGRDDAPQPFTDAYYAVVALAGLVVIFCLYTALKHRELNIMRAALEREEREKENVATRLSELSALFQVSTALNLQLRLDAILEIIVRRVVSTLRAQQASIMIYNPETGILETRASYGLESEFARHARKRLGEGIAGWVAEKLEAVQVDGNDRKQAFGQHMKSDRNITSALSLPLRVGERCVGVLNVNRINHPEKFQSHHRDVLQLFAEHVGAVIDRAEVMDRMGSRTRQLEADNLKLSEMNRLKDIFLSTATHELKTPLTSVIAYAELLDENEKALDKEQRREFLKRLRGEATRLLTLIDEILDLSRLESGKLTLHRMPIAINDVAKAAAETSRPLAKRRTIEIEEIYDTTLPSLPVDEVKMRQVLVNLLVNAIKFSPDHTRITIQTMQEGQYLRIEVRDQGEGIDPDETASIFELFGQGERARMREGGLGIGLHIVKRVTELHGGHVGVNSVPGKGSSFWVRLPLALASSHAAEDEPQRRAA